MDSHGIWLHTYATNCTSQIPIEHDGGCCNYTIEGGWCRYSQIRTSSQFCTRCTLLQQREYNAHSYKHSPQDVKSTVDSHISWHVLHVQRIHKSKDWPEGSVGNGCEWHTKSPITMLIACWFVSSSVWTCEVNQYNVNARKLPILLLSCLWSNTAVPVVSLPVPAVVGTTAERMHVTVHAVDKWNVMILQLSKILYLPLLQ